MKYGQLIVDKKEQGLLLRSIANAHSIEDASYAAYLKKLKLELLTAKILESQKMPQDVIRFNSEITITTSGGSEQSFQIVIPEKSDITNRKISILSPMALALFGYAQGDILEWVFPSGIKNIAIIDVRQPQ
ncbi:MAG: GreA/GreB family elongation factor [Bacteroidetes bacterium]|nr:GreA/GreB family elongation factor [Bacteroidota bacterium]